MSGGGVRDRWKAEAGLIVDSSREIIKVMYYSNKNIMCGSYQP